MFGGLGTSELLLLLVIILLLFGSTRLPQLARALGQSMREFRRGLENEEKGEPETADRGGDS